jgi:uncharacterized membrane protein YkoI
MRRAAPAATPAGALVGAALLAALLAVVLAAGTAPVRADSDHDRARRAFESGQVAPLADILAAVDRDFVGRVIAVELERDDGRWIYEIKLLTPGGAIIKLIYDAASGALLRAQGRGAEAARRR